MILTSELYKNDLYIGATTGALWRGQGDPTGVHTMVPHNRLWQQIIFFWYGRVSSVRHLETELIEFCFRHPVSCKVVRNINSGGGGIRKHDNPNLYFAYTCLGAKSA